ncbi:uncharacterized protein LOC143852193 [Tasmannia lanceolata]|uniref:uncharacterized protein LOC143852193 n=1 Tax=Tasmannia lanceolata TaxID=3420 RepID=UPI004063E49F
MVQRKAVHKLGIQAESRKDHVKSDKWFMSLKPSSQNHDIKNKGGSELKKKMKKARSFKALNLETSLGSPFNISSHTTPQEKPSLTKIESSHGSPNYMKPTSSWDARKEGLKVNSHSRTTCSSNSKISKNSDTYSLKPMKKILRKTSSLKPVRSSMKKSSSLVGSYSNQNVNRATCSSTLKDSKFPEFVALHPGSTESEGTSIIKVCPYTYCSLNGHHHAPLPPLKRFLSARRRLLKTQKSMMLKGLSPSRIKASGGRKKEIDTGQMDSIVDPTILDEDSYGSAGIDFFVEIYARSREETKELVKQDDGKIIHYEDDKLTSEFSVTPNSFDEISLLGDDEIPNGSAKASEVEMEEDIGDAESQLDVPHFKMSTDDDLDQNRDFFAEEMDILMSSPEFDNDLQVEVPDIEYSSNLIQSDQVETGFNSGIESESDKDCELDESISETSDMDCEEEQVISYPYNETDFSTVSVDGSDLLIATFGSGDYISTCEEATADGEILQEVHEEDVGDFNAAFRSGDSEGNGNNLDGDHTSENGGIFEIERTDMLSHVDVICFPLLSATTEYSAEKPTEGHEEENGNREMDNVSLQVDSLLGGSDEPVNSLQDDPEMDNPILTEDQRLDQSHAGIDADVWPQINELETISDVLEGETSESIDSEAKQETVTSDDKTDQALGADVEAGGEKTDKIEDATGLLEIEIFVSSPGYSGAGLDITNEDDSLVQTMESEGCLCDEKNCSQETVVDPNSIVLDLNIHPENGTEREKQTEDSIPDQDYSGLLDDIDNEDQPPVDLNRTIFDQSDIGKIVKIREHSETDQKEHGGNNISSSLLYEECNNTEKSESNSSADCNGSDDKMKIEDGADSDAMIINIATDSNQPLPMARHYLKGITNRKGKRTLEDSKEIRKFNPKEPRYLIPEPDPEAEKVDLRHQMMDERKSSEEWMLDYALRRAVNKLAPSQKRRVTLLIQAFETVIPEPKYETHLRHATTRFTHAIPVQACS